MKAKASRTIRCAVPIIASTPFLVFAVIGIRGVGPHPVAIGLGLVGLLAMAVGLFYGVCRIEYGQHGFTVRPGNRNYTLQDVVSWRAGEDTDAEPGYRRHLELQFRPWYRRYILFEQDVGSQAFETLLKSLYAKQKAEPGACT